MSQKLKYKQKPVLSVPQDERIIGTGGDNKLLNPKSRFLPGVNGPSVKTGSTTKPGKKLRNPLNPYL